MDWQFILTQDAEALPDGFDRFLADAPFAAYQQSRAWTQAVPAGRHDHLFFAATDADGAIMGAAIVRRSPMAPGYWLASVQRGPVVRAIDAFAPVLAGLIGELSRTACCSVQLAPRVRGRDMPQMLEAMRAAGLAPLPADRQPLHCATGIVWLDHAEDEILAGFKQRARRQLKAGTRAGIKVRPVGDVADIAAFQRVIDAFRETRPDYDMHGLPDAHGQAQLIAQLGGAMLLAEHEGRIIGGHSFVRQADEAIWLAMATTGDDPTLPRAYSLLWEAMRVARAMGCVGYDLAGMPLDQPRDAGEANRMQFKNAFAPHRRVLPPMHVAPVKRLPHAVLFAARQAYRAWKRPAKRRAA